MEELRNKIDTLVYKNAYACIGVAFIVGFALGALHHYFGL